MPRSFYYNSHKSYDSDDSYYKYKKHRKHHNHHNHKCPTGQQGPTGQNGNILGGANFYALMPNDNSATIAPGSNIEFPNNGPNTHTIITRISASTFNLSNIGTYLIQFQVSIAEAGQQCITLNP